jgi:hypothetical protein
MAAGKGWGGEGGGKGEAIRRREERGAPIGSNVHLFSVRDRRNRVGGEDLQV